MNARTGMLRWAVLPALVAAALALVSVFALDQTALAQEGDDSQAPTPEPDGLFYDVKGESPPSIGVDSLASRLVGIDYEQLAQVTAPPISPKDSATEISPTPQTLVLNLFDDVVFTGIVEHVEPTSSGHALWGNLDGVELGTMTLVVNGSVVVGTVRTARSRSTRSGLLVTARTSSARSTSLPCHLWASPSGGHCPRQRFGARRTTSRWTMDQRST